MIDQETFEQIAARDVKGEATEEEAAWLRSEENVADFRDAVTNLLRDVDAQLTEKAAALNAYHAECHNLEEGKQLWFDGLAQYQAWRAGAIRVKTSCQKRITELKRLARRRHAEKSERASAERIARAIEGDAQGAPVGNRPIREELHRMRTALARIMEDSYVDVFEVEDWRISAGSHPYARMERNAAGDGWTVLIEYPEEEGGAA